MITATQASGYQPITSEPLFRKRNLGKFIFPARLLTVPKSGTHMLEKCLVLLGYPQKYVGPPHHAYYPNETLVWDKKFIMQVRDCRDVLVSLVSHVDKIVNSYLTTGTSKSSGFVNDPTKWKKWTEKSFDEKLMDAITHNNETGYDFIWANKQQWEKAAELYPKCQSHPKKILLTRFEHLVGREGGGRRYHQEQEIKRIANFLALPLDFEKSKYVQENLWGSKGSATFHKGQIGRWKEHFKPEHVKAFLPKFQKYLELFGYEKNEDWAKPYLEEAEA